MKKKLQQLSIHRLIGLSFALLALLTTANIAHSDELMMQMLVKNRATKSPASLLRNFEGYFLRKVKTPGEEGKTYGEGKKDTPLHLGDISEDKKEAFLAWLEKNEGKKILIKGNYDYKQVGNNEQTDTDATDQSFVEQSVTTQMDIKVFKPYYLAKPIDELGI